MSTIKQCINESLTQYFDHLEGERASGIYELVIGSAERSMLEFLMQRYADNQSQVAEVLGINRNTLRAKLVKHQLKAL